jgi:hypothetical protein
MVWVPMTKLYENLDALIPTNPLSPNFDGGFK